MKMRITGNSLIYVILAQVLIIELLMSAILMNKIGSKSKTSLLFLSRFNMHKFSSIRSEKVVRKNKVPQLFIKNSDINRLALGNDIIKDLFCGIRLPVNKPVITEARKAKIKGKKFTATAYDLSYRCCGKNPWDPAYGITYSGRKAVKGRTIAVDPVEIPIGSSVYIGFPDPYKKLDGWYIAEDTGNMVKGRVVDIYFGESALTEILAFGRRNVEVFIKAPEGTGK